MTYRPATTDDVPRVLALFGPDPASALTVGTFRERLSTGEYRPEWTWLAEAGTGDDGVEAAGVWWGDTAPNGLDALLARPGLPRDRRIAVAGGLMAAAHRSFDPNRTLPAFQVQLPVDWRERREVTAALSWRWEAAVAAGLTDELERLRFEWAAGTAIPRPTGRLVFRREPEDQVFAHVFRHALAGTLDATSRRMADVVGEPAQARSDVDFYRNRMRGDRGWWFTASRPDGELVGFGVPSRNNKVPVVGYLGVLPEHRGHGYIDDILAEVTRILAAEARAGVIHADTDVANKPMAAAFERAGYRNIARRVVLSAPIRLTLPDQLVAAGEADGGQGPVGVGGGLHGSGRRGETEQPPPVALPQQQAEQRLGQRLVLLTPLDADVLGEPGDVARVAVTVKDAGQFGEPAGLGDYQAVQPH